MGKISHLVKLFVLVIFAELKQYFNDVLIAVAVAH